jgi:hypothetical protein
MVMKLHMGTHSRVWERGGAYRGAPIVAARPRVRDRITARWRTRRLDVALAAGAPTEADPALALRARRLTALPCRRLIADALREARDGAPPTYVRVRPARTTVVAASEELSLLADTLAEPGPVAAHGVAQAWMLVTDGTGPLYNPSSSASLPARAASAARALRLRS